MAIESSQITKTNNFQSDGSQQNFLGSNPGYVGYTGNPSGTRLQQAGLAPGGVGLLGEAAGKVFNINFSSSDCSVVPAEIDWRVRISMARATAALFYNDPTNFLLNPLSVTNGVIFPFTPSITVRHTAKYGDQPLTHANYNSYFYENSAVEAIRIQADFTCQNVAEGQYFMAAIHFFRTCTKMFYGNSPLAGNPPPLVFLDGFGSPYFPHVPCVVTGFDHTLPKDVDYIQVPLSVAANSTFRAINPSQIDTANNMYGSFVSLPTHSEIILSLQPVYSRNNIANNFTLEKYGKGDLIENGTSTLGGFI